MLKMVIRMNDDKITAENKYRLDGIYNTINHTFQTVGLPRMEDGSGALVFRDCGRARDFSLFGRIVNTLKRQTWFMDNVSVWRLCDSDDSDSPDDFNEEEDCYEILTSPEEFDAVNQALADAGVTFASAEVTMIPQTTVDLTSEDDIKKMNRILGLLDEDDDVQNVYHNWNEPEDDEESLPKSSQSNPPIEFSI